MKKINFKKIFLLFLTVLGIILIFGVFDYLAHQVSVEYAVPPRYFPNKIIYGTLFGFIIAVILMPMKRAWLKSLIFSAVISVLLQIKYFLEGYPLDFVVLFLFIHFGILWLVSGLAFKYITIK